MKEQLYKVLLSPHVSEKTTRVGEAANQYTFKVAKTASKQQIKEAVEALFDVNVLQVRTVNMKGKSKTFRFRSGKRSDWKKAYVSLAEGQSIDFYGTE